MAATTPAFTHMYTARDRKKPSQSYPNTSRLRIQLLTKVLLILRNRGRRARPRKAPNLPLVVLDAANHADLQDDIFHHPLRLAASLLDFACRGKAVAGRSGGLPLGGSDGTVLRCLPGLLLLLLLPPRLLGHPSNCLRKPRLLQRGRFRALCGRHGYDLVGLEADDDLSPRCVWKIFAERRYAVGDDAGGFPRHEVPGKVHFARFDLIVEFEGEGLEAEFLEGLGVTAVGKGAMRVSFTSFFFLLLGLQERWGGRTC